MAALNAVTATNLLKMRLLHQILFPMRQKTFAIGTVDCDKSLAVTYRIPARSWQFSFERIEQAEQNPGHGFVQNYEDGSGNTVLAVTYWKLAKTPKKSKPKARPIPEPDPNQEDHTDDLYFKSGRTKKGRRKTFVDPNQMDLFGEKKPTD